MKALQLVVYIDCNKESCRQQTTEYIFIDDLIEVYMKDSLNYLSARNLFLDGKIIYKQK